MMTHSYRAPYTAYINGVDILDCGALVRSYTIGGTAVQNVAFKGRNRTTIRQLAHTIGTRDITLELFFAAPTQHELALQKSRLDALLLGTPELHLPDGFYYQASLQSAGDLQMLGVEDNQVIAECTYKLKGIRRSAPVSYTGNTIYAEGTMPQMDCVLRCTASRAYSSLQLGPVVFSNVPAGAEVVADGVNGILTVNGAAVAATLTRLPYLVPGEQTIECPETLTIEYSPTWL